MLVYILARLVFGRDQEQTPNYVDGTWLKHHCLHHITSNVLDVTNGHTDVELPCINNNRCLRPNLWCPQSHSLEEQ